MQQRLQTDFSFEHGIDYFTEYVALIDNKTENTDSSAKQKFVFCAIRTVRFLRNEAMRFYLQFQYIDLIHYLLLVLKRKLARAGFCHCLSLKNRRKFFVKELSEF